MRRATTLIGMILLACVGCESTQSGDTTRPSLPAALSDEGGRSMVRTEIVFSLSKDDGTAVDEFAWDKFVDDAIAVWFPSGFTVEDAKGRWRGTDGKIVSERSKVLILFHDGSDATLKKIDEVRRLYVQRFGQKSVIRASSQVWLAF